jgi:hypothetical protein
MGHEGNVDIVLERPPEGLAEHRPAAEQTLVPAMKVSPSEPGVFEKELW